MKNKTIGDLKKTLELYRDDEEIEILIADDGTIMVVVGDCILLQK